MCGSSSVNVNVASNKVSTEGLCASISMKQRRRDRRRPRSAWPSTRGVSCACSLFCLSLRLNGFRHLCDDLSACEFVVPRPQPQRFQRPCLIHERHIRRPRRLERQCARRRVITIRAFAADVRRDGLAQIFHGADDGLSQRRRYACILRQTEQRLDLLEKRAGAARSSRRSRHRHCGRHRKAGAKQRTPRGRTLRARVCQHPWKATPSQRTRRGNADKCKPAHPTGCSARPSYRSGDPGRDKLVRELAQYGGMERQRHGGTTSTSQPSKDEPHCVGRACVHSNDGPCRWTSATGCRWKKSVCDEPAPSVRQVASHAKHTESGSCDR